MNIVSVSGLAFAYPDGRKALSSVSFDVEAGELVTLCGASGCGKSTLLRMLKPELSPRGEKSGDILFCGEALHSLPTARTACEIGFVMQDPEAGLVTDKVWHELAFSLESAGFGKDEIRRRVGEMAGYFGLEQVFERSCAELSGGQKQLVALASAAVLHPKLLLLDEPSSQLDPIAAQSLIEVISRLNRDFGITVIIAEHRLEELLHISDRVIVMDGGGIAADCPPRDICLKLPKNHPMMMAMPAAVRLFALSGGTGGAPLSVGEGRTNEVCLGGMEKIPQNKRREAPRGEVLISAKRLWVSYDKNSPDVLKSADIEVRAGGVFALLGGNGSGKTTLLKCLNGAIKPLGGSIKRKKGLRTAYLPQNPCEIFTEDTVADEFKSACDDYVEVMRRFGLSQLAESHPYDLSGGEQQRLAIAKLMLKKPDVLLLDEPTKGMDAFGRQSLCQMLRELCGGGTAVVLVTHDTELAAMCADSCALLFGGEVSGADEPVTFFSDNYFYTTPARRLTRGIRDEIVYIERSGNG